MFFCKSVICIGEQADLETLLNEGLLQPSFMVVQSIKFSIAGDADFLQQFKKIVTPYNKIGHNINALWQTACMVGDPIMVVFNVRPQSFLLTHLAEKPQKGKWQTV